MIETDDISKVFRTSEVETVALDHVNLDVKGGRVCSHYGAVRLRQVHLAEYSGSAGQSYRRASYKLLGQEVADLKEKERTRVRKGQLGFALFARAST